VPAIHYESRDVLADLIKKYLIDSAGVDPEKFKDPDLKVADLGLDSLGLVEMLFEVEDKFGFQIPEPMAFLPMSFAEMVASIDDMVRAQSNQNLQKTDTAS
jgi:acyl carrier protein